MPGMRDEVVMQSYYELLSCILEYGVKKTDRTGVGTVSLHGCSMSFDLAEGYPLWPQRKINIKPVLVELLWFLGGDMNPQILLDQQVYIWEPWVRRDGTLGRIYGAQWRRWNTPYGDVIDQIRESEKLLQDDPYSRRNIVTAWNPGELDQMALPPCHMQFQLLARPQEDNVALDLRMYQRSMDAPVGGAFNIASYAALLQMYATTHGFTPGMLYIDIGDAHIYTDQIDIVKDLLKRPHDRKLPTLKLKWKRDSVLDYIYDDFQLVGYDPHPAVRLPVAV